MACEANGDGDDWLFEIEHDGFRIHRDPRRWLTRLLYRNGYDINRRHRHMAKRLGRLSVQRFVLEGEPIVLDDDGRSNFARQGHGWTQVSQNPTLRVEVDFLEFRDDGCASDRAFRRFAYDLITDL